MKLDLDQRKRRYVGMNGVGQWRNAMNSRQRVSALIQSLASTALVTAFIAFAAQSARADDAAKFLKAMTDYTAAQKSISATFDSDIEVVTPELEKIQFTSSGKLQLARPDKLRISRTGGYADVQLVYDGKTVSIYGNNAKAYVQADLAGTVDQLVDLLQARSGAAMPGTDLLLTQAYDELMSNVIVGQHIGQGVIDGVECEHLAFRGGDTDWQIWIESGANPVPRKYVITSKTLAGAPQYTLKIKQWKTDGAEAADAFVFKPPADAQKVDLNALAMIEFD